MTHDYIGALIDVSGGHPCYVLDLRLTVSYLNVYFQTDATGSDAKNFGVFVFNVICLSDIEYVSWNIVICIVSASPG